MTDNLKGLFGGGSGDDDSKKKQLSDFANRYTEGDPNVGYSDDEARQNFQEMVNTAPPDVIQRAAQKTYARLPENQRSELNQMLQDRQQGKNLVDIQRSGEQGGATQGGGQDPLSDLFGGLMGGAGGGGLGDILGGLLGGGGDRSSGGSSSGGSSSGGGLGDIVGGLFGGGDDNDQTTRQTAPRTNTGATAGGGVGDMFGGLLSGPMGKVIMGGIAAYAAKELMDKK